MEVKARAPGKIILSGEHAVVHGSTAIAASIDLYTYVSVQLFPPSENGDAADVLKLQLKDMTIECVWPITRIKEAFSYVGPTLATKPTRCSEECLKTMSILVEEQNLPEVGISLISGVSAFLWLFLSIQGFKPATVIVSSDLPLGSGLGSSAAFCVALSACLLALTDTLNVDANQEGWFSPEKFRLELLNMWAFEGERIIHGNPSGIDNTISTHGNMVKFVDKRVTIITCDVPLKMLITNTKVTRNTKALVAKVLARTRKHGSIMNHIFSAIDAISTELLDVIQCHNLDGASATQNEEKIEELMKMNQALLESMEVSHDTIGTVCRVARKYGLASKLTGAGGGGSVLTLLPSSLSSMIIDELIAELKSHNFDCFIARIGGSGVEMCFNGHL